MENGEVRKLKTHSHGSLHKYGSKNSDDFVSIKKFKLNFDNFLFFSLLLASHVPHSCILFYTNKICVFMFSQGAGHIALTLQFN